MSRRRLFHAALLLLLLVNTWAGIARIGFFITRYAGEHALALARMDEAVDGLEASIWWQPGNAPSHILLARAVHLSMANGLHLKAWPGASPEDLLAAGTVLVTHGVALSPADAWAWFNLAQVYRGYQFGDQRRSRLRAPSRDQEEISEPSGLAPGDDVIIAASLMAQALEPAFFFYRDFLAQLYLRRGLLEEAEAEIRESFRLMPLPSAHGTLDDEIIRQLAGPVEEGIQFAAAGTHMTPALIARAWAEFNQVVEREEEAVVAWRDLRALAGEVVWDECDYRSAVLYQRLDRYAESLPFLERVVADGGGGIFRARSLQLLARARSNEGDHRAALEVLAEYRDALPRSFRPLIYMAREWELIGDMDEAGRLYRTTARRFPGEPRAWTSYIRFLRQQGQVREALLEAEEFTRRHPDDPQAGKLVEDLRTRLRR
ncbi:MAG: tetratricopeptide repeat protein [Acidobacteria bacterium]|nr:tetratricopeptide repeat protein [Acidobacteriota bacterium]